MPRLRLVSLRNPCDEGMSESHGIMKRVIWGLAALLFAVSGLLTALPLFVSTDFVRASIAERAVQLTGRNISFRDAPRITYIPYLGVEIGNVIFEDQDAGTDTAPLLQMEQLRGRLDIAAALFGRVEIKRFELVRPRFNLQTFADGSVSWAFPNGKIYDALASAREARLLEEGGETVPAKPVTPVQLGGFEIIDGTVNYTNQNTGNREAITNINARIGWENTSAPFTLTGNCIHRDEAIEYSLRTETPMSLLSGGAAPLTYSLKSGAFNANFKGQANRLADLHLTGRFSFSSPSIRRMSGFFGEELQPGSTLVGISAEGELKGTLKQLQLSDALITIDGNSGRGVLQLSRSKKNKALINGTLAAERLNLAPYLAALRQDAELGKAGLPGMAFWKLFDMDLRISAAQADAGKISLADVAASITVQDSNATLNIGNAIVMGGTVVGKLDLSSDEAGATLLDAHAMYSGFDAAAVSAAFGTGRISMTGSGNAEIRLKSRGVASKAVIENIWGVFQAAGGPGSIDGIDFAALHRTAAADEGDGSDIAFSGHTDFEKFNAEIAFNHNLAWIRSLQLENQQISARVAGRSALDLSAIALTVTTKTKEADTTSTPNEVVGEAGETVQLFIGGSMATPLVTRIRAVPPN
jgi:AsmA protein